MRILGIDPGYDRLGIAVIEKNKNQKETIIFSECFQTSPQTDFKERLFGVGERVFQVIDTHKPQVFAIEKLFFNSNQKTVMQVSQTIGALIFIAEYKQLPVFEYTPLQIKSAIAGNGRADKKDIYAMLQHLIALPQRKALDDEYDAIAVALTCAASERFSF